MAAVGHAVAVVMVAFLVALCTAQPPPTCVSRPPAQAALLPPVALEPWPQCDRTGAAPLPTPWWAPAPSRASTCPRWKPAARKEAPAHAFDVCLSLPPPRTQADPAGLRSAPAPAARLAWPSRSTRRPGPASSRTTATPSGPAQAYGFFSSRLHPSGLGCPVASPRASTAPR
jgi:hypothetical protein